jgi:hypothetical protein
VRARDSQGFGRCRAGRKCHECSDDVGQACQWDEMRAWEGAYRRISLGGGGKGIVGITLRGYEEGIEVVLTTLDRMRMWKRISFVGNLCLRGKV